MGWCSGTYVFDVVVEDILAADIQESDKVKIISNLIRVLEYMDWDCQTDSDFFDNPVVKKAFIATNKRWELHYKEMEE